MLNSYIVDAFTDTVFKGNPAAVLFLPNFMSDHLMQNIAMENKLSETAFAVKKDSTHYDLRWFTPGGEIDLCGHATLATGFLVFKYASPKNSQTIIFSTKSGDLTVTKKDDLYEMNFPSYDLTPIPVTSEMAAAFGEVPQEAYLGRDLLCAFSNKVNLENLHPDFDKLSTLDGLLQHATVADKQYDCLSRSFAPKLNVPEDPVCGSGHCHIIPYWSKRLGKNKIVAYQASPRSGVLYCDYQGTRTLLSGNATLYSTSKVFI